MAAAIPGNKEGRTLELSGPRKIREQISYP